MKRNDRLISDRMKRIVTEVSWYGNVLYSSACPFQKAAMLEKLRFNMQELLFLSNAVLNEELIKALNLSAQARENSNPESISAPSNQIFTISELARFTGRNGNPAYVAVQGVVYDVTNNAAWAAATHFGLTAGRDLTNQFASCHAGQPFLNSLPVVGRLV